MTKTEKEKTNIVGKDFGDLGLSLHKCPGAGLRAAELDMLSLPASNGVRVVSRAQSVAQL